MSAPIIGGPHNEDREQVTRILEQFYYSFPWSFDEIAKVDPKKATLGEYLSEKEEKHKIVAALRAVLEKDNSGLVIAATAKIYQYLFFYGIQSNGLDQLKFAYFLGVSLSETVGISNLKLSTMIMLSTVEILDIMCAVERGTRMSPDMKRKLQVSIIENSVTKDFGQYGIYHSFKTLHKTNPELTEKK